MDFNNDQKYNLLSKMGYTGPPEGPMMEAFLSSNPGAAAKMGKFVRVAKKRSAMAEGGTVAPPTDPNSPGNTLAETGISQPESLITKTEVANVNVGPDTLISPTTGQLDKTNTVTPTTVDTTATVQAPVAAPTTLTEAKTSAADVAAAADKTKTVTGEVKPEAVVTAAQQTTSSIADMKADQGAAYLMTNPVERKVQAGELIDGTSVDASKVKALTENIQAAQATPTKQATVQGQLEGLMKGFEGGNTPAWAAGAMRTAMGTLAARGLGASSLAGQAVIQAAMESATPIAQADAKIVAEFELSNLSNRQQVAILAAEQRATFLGIEFDQNFRTKVENAAKINDIANQNFTAEQNIALENSRAVNTMNIANLSAKNAMTLAKASALANLDVTNLENRQQAAVQNASAFLQMDFKNLDNAQQTEIFKAKANIDAILTDSAAENVARNLNATNKNQTDQFYASLTSNVQQFNANQANAMAQYNAGEKNAAEKFNAEQETMRQQFNANNSLAIAQANAQWRQNATTLDTAAQNNANAADALAMNGLTTKAMDEIWQKERDYLSYAFTSIESEKQRAAELLLGNKQLDASAKAASDAEKGAMAAVVAKIVFGDWG